MLCRHLGLAKADDDIHTLAFSISGLGVMLHIGCDVVTTIRPQLVASHAALDRYCDRLVAYAMALIEAEAQRRTLLAASPRSTRKTAK